MVGLQHRIFQATKSRKVSHVTVRGYNFLLANTRKFQRLTINPRNSDSDKETEALQIEDQIITNTSQIKLLRVEIKDILYFTNHITNICIKELSESWCSIETAKFDSMQRKTDNLQIIHPASLNILPFGMA